MIYKPSDVQETGVRVLRSSNINEDTFVCGNDDVFVNPKTVNIDTVKQNDILITSANGSSRLVGKHALIKGIPNESAIHGGFMLLGRTKNYDFINASMNSSWYIRFINIYVTGGNGAIGNLSKSDLDEQLILVPSDLEQKKIGVYFANLDHLITLHQQKITLLTKLKKAMLEKMFPKKGSVIPEFRFNGFANAWEQRKFEDMAVRSSEISSETILPRVEYEDIISGTGCLNKNIFDKESCKNGIIFHKGDVLYGKLRPYLQNWLLPSFNGIAVGDFWVLKPQNVDSSFLYILIQSRKFDEIANQSTGTKMPRADWNLVSKSKFFIPCTVDEQATIGTYFKRLDNLITLHQRKIDMLKKLKSACLSEMFI